MVGVLRVHGGEEGLVLELVRVAGAAAAASAAVAGPAVASHSPWPLADTATRASTSQALASLSPLASAMGGRRGGRVTQAGRGGGTGVRGGEGRVVVTDLFSSIYQIGRASCRERVSDQV